jgi:hypothetical protein
MDINAALERMRELSDQASKLADIPDADLTAADILILSQMADMLAVFEAIDGWLSKGGFLPDAWKRG